MKAEKTSLRMVTDSNAELIDGIRANDEKYILQLWRYVRIYVDTWHFDGVKLAKEDLEDIESYVFCRCLEHIQGLSEDGVEHLKVSGISFYLHYCLKQVELNVSRRSKFLNHEGLDKVDKIIGYNVKINDKRIEIRDIVAESLSELIAEEMINKGYTVHWSIFCIRVYTDRSLDSIAKEFGYTRERIHQICKKREKLLKKRIVEKVREFGYRNLTENQLFNILHNEEGGLIL